MPYIFFAFRSRIETTWFEHGNRYDEMLCSGEIKGPISSSREYNRYGVLARHCFNRHAWFSQWRKASMRAWFLLFTGPISSCFFLPKISFYGFAHLSISAIWNFKLAGNEHMLLRRINVNLEYYVFPLYIEAVVALVFIESQHGRTNDLQT